jgi:hypothetical protein
LGEGRVKADRSEGKIFLAAKIICSGGGSSTGVFFSVGSAAVQGPGAAEGVEGSFAAETGHAAGGSRRLLRRVAAGRERSFFDGRRVGRGWPAGE